MYLLFLSVCGPIANCNHRGCTTGSNQICEWCYGEVKPQTYWRAYTSHLDNTKCQSKYGTHLVAQWSRSYRGRDRMVVALPVQSMPITTKVVSLKPRSW
jgi:hypothetical protein